MRCGFCGSVSSELVSPELSSGAPSSIVSPLLDCTRQVRWSGDQKKRRNEPSTRGRKYCQPSDQAGITSPGTAPEHTAPEGRQMGTSSWPPLKTKRSCVGCQPPP